jgi:hypothetical protein
MKTKRFIFLAKLGVIESTNELGEYDIQRIDCPKEFKEDNNLSFVPFQLKDDAEAKRLFNSLTHSRLENLNNH